MTKSTDLNREPFFQIGDDLLAAWDDMVDGASFRTDTDRWQVSNPDETAATHGHLALVFLALGSKGSKTFRSILLLCRQDFGDDALILLRTLIETYATLKWIIEKDWQIRLYEYRVYAALQQEKIWTALTHNPVMSDDPRMAEQNQVDVFLAEARKRLNPKRIQTLKSTRPDGSVKASLDRWNEGSLYDAWYRLGATAAHGTDHFNHVTLSKEGAFDLGEPSRWTVFVLFAACRVFRDILSLVQDVGSYAVDDRIRSIDARLLAAAGLPSAGSPPSDS